MMRIHRLAMLAMSLLIVSCGLDATGPASFEAEGLEIRAQVEPAVLAAGDSAAVVVVFRNHTSSEIFVGTAMSCPFFLKVFDRSSGQSISMEGTGYVCAAVLAGFDIAAADSVVWRQSVVARVNGLPMERGHYKAHLSFTTGTPDLEAAFAVR